jgi:N-acetylmuramoyl-L-alanine amidase
MSLSSMPLSSRFLSARLRTRLLLWAVAALLAVAIVPIAKSAPSATENQLTVVNNVRVWRGEQYTRLVLDLNAPVQHSLVLEETPMRILLDIPDTLLNTSLVASLSALILTGTPVDIIRATVTNQKDLHLVFTLNKNVLPKSFFLKKQGTSDDRLVIDLYDTTESLMPTEVNLPAVKEPVDKEPVDKEPVDKEPVDKEPANIEDLIATIANATKKDASKTVEAPTVATTTVAVELNNLKPAATKAPNTKVNEAKIDEAKIDEAKANELKMNEQKMNDRKVVEVKTIESKINIDLGGKRTILIAVDAGHGGEDSGALGPKGLREKDITLAIAKELATIIKAQPGFSAHLTRSSDFFIPLQKRRNIARDMKADLFVSIHADAFTNASAKGASVFALSRRGATSEAARFLAQRENESDLFGGVGGVSLDDKDAVLAGVLVDLSMTATVNSSLQVGDSVLNSIAALAPLHARHVEQAGFMVLKSPDVPSILIETGFISNKEESRQLASPAYRVQMAQAVFKGLHQYFLQNPPAGTYIAAQQFGDKAEAIERQHRVVRGDTLAFIASRYNVNLNQLLKYNGLTSTLVKVGQTIKIPAS